MSLSLFHSFLSISSSVRHQRELRDEDDVFCDDEDEEREEREPKALSTLTLKLSSIAGLVLWIDWVDG